MNKAQIAVFIVLISFLVFPLFDQLTEPWVIFKEGKIDHVNMVTPFGFKKMEPIPEVIPPGWNSWGDKPWEEPSETTDFVSL
jgi:hypothetical protein